MLAARGGCRPVGRWPAVDGRRPGRVARGLSARQGQGQRLAHPGAPAAHRARSRTRCGRSPLQQRLEGDKATQGKVAKLAKGQYVELQREGTDPMFVVLVEFGDNQYPDPRFQGPPPDGSATDVTGPLHNQIPEPDRAVDNRTLWQSDYNLAHYQDMYFNRMATYYETQSSGRYSVEGTVTDWVKVPFNEALYGRNYCGGIVCNTTKALVRDALAVWVKQPARPRARRCRRSRTTSRPSTSRTATTSTVTATSTSRTASSTTSRSCTRAATRRPATPTRAPTPSGATARYANLQAGGPLRGRRQRRLQRRAS